MLTPAQKKAVFSVAVFAELTSGSPFSFDDDDLIDAGVYGTSKLEEAAKYVTDNRRAISNVADDTYKYWESLAVL